MKKSRKYIFAFMAACIVPALFIVMPYGFDSLSRGDGYGWVRTKNFGLMALVISSGHVLLLGLPLFIIMNIKKVVFWWSSILAGFILGCIPLAFWSWPLRYAEGSSSSHWDGEKMVDTIIDGVVTTAGWLSYINGVAFMGLFGAIGGFSFWLVWRIMSPNKRLQFDAAMPRD